MNAKSEQAEDAGRPYSRGEVAVAMMWLCAGSLISLFIECAYVHSRLTLPGGGSVMFPITIVIAALFNGVLTRTALLWSRNIGVVAIPVLSWLVGYFLLLFGPAITGDQLLGSSMRSLVLLIAGMAGGAWPLLRSRIEQL
ncbi:hypothetical protein L1O03_06800 [Corynebacterium uropygiale]|uniref:Uncharacterized protein n=1 Tax=Corynebacterium uropygiale TaxID=1775911 RepID=A0A9X1QQF2_9CORY|nr:hypothetical protein [Corynebacterium uropygiale]MCF4006886.1 hypothetical protein [Corynebacterium uropygiale]